MPKKDYRRANDIVNMALMTQSIESIQKDLQEINAKLDNNYVTKDQMKLVMQEFEPYKSIVVWLLGLVGVESVALLFFLIRTIIINGLVK